MCKYCLEIGCTLDDVLQNLSKPQKYFSIVIMLSVLPFDTNILHLCTNKLRDMQTDKYLYIIQIT